MPSDDLRLGGLLRYRREQLALSIRETARRARISPSYLMALERGRNPSTGRASIPSPQILLSLSDVLDIELATLLDAAATAPSKSVHLLLIQAGAQRRPPLDAARRIFAGDVDSWIEVGDPRWLRNASQSDVVVAAKGPLAATTFDGARVLEELSRIVARAPKSAKRRRVGIVFGANSALLRSIENPPDLLASERTWERDVAAVFTITLGVEPAANVCVYREDDLQELAGRVDPLATLVTLIDSHPHVAVQQPDGTVLAGPAALEAILAAVRPPGVTAETWQALTHAAAAGFARDRALPSAHSNRA